MTRLAEIESHIATMGDLRDVVGAMRSLAGMRAQEAQRTLPGVRRYADAMASAVGDALLLVPDAVPIQTPHLFRAVVLFTAEHGFVGDFNRMLIDAALSAREEHDVVFVVGSRGAALARERGLRITWARPMASRAAGAPETIRALAAELYRRLARDEFVRVEVVFARSQGGARMIVRQTLLPLETAPLGRKRGENAPLYNIAPRPLLEKLMAEYVIALLTAAAVESIASENAARFAAMDSALDNVDEKLGELRRSERQARQDEITAELLDLVTGSEALRKMPSL